MSDPQSDYRLLQGDRRSLAEALGDALPPAAEIADHLIVLWKGDVPAGHIGIAIDRFDSPFAKV